MLDKTGIIFGGRKSINVKPILRTIQNTFTYEFWVKPKALHDIDLESNGGRSGIKGQRFVIFPGHGGIEGEAGVGVSVGTNGISVYEHTQNHLPALLVLKHSISDWVHVAIVINKKTPYLYINGKYQKTGLKSRMNKIFASGTFGGLDPYGFFTGAVDDIRVWNHPRTKNQILMNMNHQLTGQEDGLFLYWNSKNGKEIIVNDLVNNDGISNDLRNHNVINTDFNKKQSDNKWASVPIPLSADTIVLISGGSAYNATCHFGYELEKAFSQLGYKVELFEDVRKLRRIDWLLKEQNVFFILGMNGHGIPQLYNDVYENKLPVPYFAYLVDHPMYHLHRFDFNSSPQNLIVSCVDRTHVDFLKTYFSGNFLKVFIPHGSALSIPDAEIKPIKDRPIDIL